MIRLPEAFEKKMESLLGEEYGDFRDSCHADRCAGLRFNPLKGEVRKMASLSPFPLRQVPWCPDGFYYGSEERPGKHPLHEAGLYYIQEPSAMAAAELLAPAPGEAVLDLCAAPGGKSTHIAGKMMGRGLLIANEIHPARVKVLSQNVERMGISNAVVTNETPGALAKRFPEFFDKILVDAPCSGEGMFRKDEGAALEWSPEHVKACAARQNGILNCAAAMLKPGGRLLYSTCTFSPEEDEQAAALFLERHRDFLPEDRGELPGMDRGRPEWCRNLTEIKKTYRIWPHRSEGEGHFFAVFRKAGEKERKDSGKGRGNHADRKILPLFYEFCADTLRDEKSWRERKNYLLFGGQLYLTPSEMPELTGLKTIRPGLHLGTFKKNRFEPSHAFALFLKKGQVKRFCEWGSRDTETAAYLAGEVLAAQRPEKGWLLMCVDGYSLGWAKAAGGILKNHYPRGLRRPAGQ